MKGSSENFPPFGFPAQGDEDNGDDEVNDDGDDSQQKDGKSKAKKKSRLFSMTLVNAFGSSDLQPLVDDDKPLTLSGKSP